MSKIEKTVDCRPTCSISWFSSNSPHCLRCILPSPKTGTEPLCCGPFGTCCWGKKLGQSGFTLSIHPSIHLSICASRLCRGWSTGGGETYGCLSGAMGQRSKVCPKEYVLKWGYTVRVFRRDTPNIPKRPCKHGKRYDKSWNEFCAPYFQRNTC